MTNNELTGQAMLQLHEANLQLARALARSLRRLFARKPADDAAFRAQEPDLAIEAAHAAKFN